jgi:cardiolipin synthase
VDLPVVHNLGREAFHVEPAGEHLEEHPGLRAHAGVQLAAFHPVNPLKRRWQINYRNHRKLAVCDGRVAVTGGRNIANEYFGRRQGERQWQDIAVVLRGPAVLDLQRTFMNDWYYTTDEWLDPAMCCGRPEEAGGQVVQVVPSAPRTLGGAIEWAHLLACRNARQSLRVVTPYFVPPESMISALTVAALGGVEVEIVVPGVSDSWLSLWAGRSFYHELLESGARIYEYQQSVLHGKLLIVDDEWCTAGSANMDLRSFRINYEVNCMIYDPKASRQLVRLFEHYKAGAEEVTDCDRYEARLRHRLACSLTRLASPLL